MTNNQKRHIAILGSTGSIGTQAIEVVLAHPDQFVVEVLTTNNNAELLIEQAVALKPNVVVICNEDRYDQVFSALDPLGIKVYAGAKAIASVVQMESIDIVLTAMVGYAGLLPTIKAIEAGKAIALANKETLVVAGELITQLADRKASTYTPLIPNIQPFFSASWASFTTLSKKLS